MDDLTSAVGAVEAFSSAAGLTSRIAKLEADLAKRSREQAVAYMDRDGIDASALLGALAVKAIAGQINVVVHTLGILVSLPHVLQAGEVISGLSLGAGNTGRRFDLETDRQVAEFKFISWRGGPESIRQNTLFVDFFNLASADTPKRKVLYVVGKEHPLRFLRGGRALASVLSKNAAVAARFRERHAELTRVKEYYSLVKHEVDIVDLREVVPAFRDLSDEVLAAGE